MKLFFAIVAVVCLTLYALAQTTLPTAKQEDHVVRLRWATDPNPARAVQTGLFNRTHPGIEVIVDPGLGGDQTKLIVQCATGTGPDLIDLYSVQQTYTLVQAGVLLDLTPFASAMGFGPENTYPALHGALVIEGKQYCFPCNAFGDAIIYNKAIFDDHGVPYPRQGWTYQDFIAASGRILHDPSKSGQKHYAFANYQNVGFVLNLLIGHGGHLFSPDGLTSKLDSPEAIAAMRLYDDMVHLHKVVPSAGELAGLSSAGGWGNAGLNLFSDGRGAMICIGRWYIVQLQSYPGLGEHLASAPVPRVDGLGSMVVAGTRASGINVRSPHRQEAMQFLQYLASPQYGRLIVEDGDALPPNPALARSGKDLVNAVMPDPAFHQTFVDAMKNSRPLDTSPFIDANLVSQWAAERIEQVENRIVGPEDAMRSLAGEINRKIRLDLQRRLDLQKKFQQVRGRPYTEDWK
ncbi:MAG TPA: sugar ABC transporter substrate-binding protein [Tepidisphaeraceae bacterium]|jgi:multiple sugar transport system substrate-binding protein